MSTKAAARSVAIMIFGVVVPLALLVQAYGALARLSTRVEAALATNSPAKVFAEARPHLHNADDYALYTVMSAERVNQSVVINKQIMKIVVMQIGFAVASIGTMFIILGINDGGAQGGGAAVGIKFDFKTGSTGAVVFVIGAAMAAAGGILKNDYRTVPTPHYAAVVDTVGDRARAETAAAYQDCTARKKEEAQKCFFDAFAQLNQDMLE